MPCPAMPCPATPCCVSRAGVKLRGTWIPPLPCRAMPGPALPRRALPCRVAFPDEESNLISTIREKPRHARPSHARPSLATFRPGGASLAHRFPSCQAAPGAIIQVSRLSLPTFDSRLRPHLGASSWHAWIENLATLVTSKRPDEIGGHFCNLGTSIVNGWSL